MANIGEAPGLHTCHIRNLAELEISDLLLLDHYFMLGQYALHFTTQQQSVTCQHTVALLDVMTWSIVGISDVRLVHQVIEHPHMLYHVRCLVFL